jgi:uncharacterized protein (TIGR02594 family)
MKPIQWLIDLLKSIFGGGRSVVPQQEKTADEPVSGDPKWLALARAEIGTKEIVGPEHSPAVLGYFRDAGFPEINDDETAWCAGFANAMIERAGYNGSKSLAARSFLTWGKEVTKPYPGCVVVFWRVSPRSWQGHVAFYVGETKTHVKVLGGNQSNAVTVQDYPKSQILGFREPVTAANSRTLRASAAGVVGDAAIVAAVSGKGIVEALPDALAFGEGLKQLAVYWPWFAVVGIVISLAARAAVIFARVSDLQLKGR